MLKYIDISELKNKFATLLCKLHLSANIDLNAITHKFIYSDFFLYFEENKIDIFLEKQYIELSEELFGKGIR